MTSDLKTACGHVAATAILACAAILALNAPASAGDVATRCSDYGCEAIHCNYTGDRCHHIYGAGDYDRVGYRDGYYGYRHFVCDSDGDRCYRTREAYWDYREYYRRHGYHWNHGYRVGRYYDGGYESDRLNREQYEEAREAGRYYDRDYDRDDY